jgi:hypothetical protein
MPAAIEAPRIYPTFRYRNAAKMIDWLQQAFGFALHVRYGDGDDVHHAQLTLGSSMIMLGNVRDDDYGKMASRPMSPSTTQTRSTRGPRRPAPKSWKSRPTAIMAAATSSAPTPKAMCGRSARTGQRPTTRRSDQAAAPIVDFWASGPPRQT